MKLNKISPSWFYTEASVLLKFLLIFVRGDMLVILPLLGVIAILGIFSIKWMTVAALLYVFFRFLGEMIYWLLQQFGPRKYRPYDMGLKNLDNNGIYIIYQLIYLAGLVITATTLVYFLLLPGKI